jgi:hypothetical protein
MYTSTEQVFEAFKEGRITAGEAEKKLSEVKKIKNESTARKTSIRKYIKNNASSFIEVLEMLKIAVSRFKVLQANDRRHELLENCTEEEAIAALGALKMYLPSPLNFEGQHEKILGELNDVENIHHKVSIEARGDLFDDEEFDREFTSEGSDVPQSSEMLV